MSKTKLTTAWVVALLWVATLPMTAAKEPSVKNNRLEFRVSDLNGNPVDFNDSRFQGKVLLVNLWGTWCPPCLTEIPTLVELQSTYGDRGFIVVAIAFEQGEPASRRKFLRSFASQQGMNYLVLDGGLPSNVGAAFPGLSNVRGLPVEFLIDRQGKVAAARHSSGFKKKWAARLHNEIAALLQQPVKPATQDSTPDR